MSTFGFTQLEKETEKQCKATQVKMRKNIPIKYCTRLLMPVINMSKTNAHLTKCHFCMAYRKLVIKAHIKECELLLDEHDTSPMNNASDIEGSKLYDNEQENSPPSCSKHYEDLGAQIH